MNYLKEINAFYDWLETKPLSTSAITLWYALMHINNKTGWANSFAVAVSVLCVKTGLAERSVSNARNELERKGYVKYQSRKGNRSAIYQMVSLSAINADSVSDSVSDNLSDNLSDSVSALFKLNKTKLNEIEISDADSNPFLFYERNFGLIGSMAQQDIIAWETTLSTELVIEAMKRTVKANKRSWNYVEAILQSWHKNGINTIGAVLAEQAEFERQKAAKGGKPIGQSYSTSDQRSAFSEYENVPF